jgi:hypothetical protein
VKISQKQIENLIIDTITNAKLLNIKVNDVLFIIEGETHYYAVISALAENLPNIIVCNNGIRLFKSASSSTILTFNYIETAINYTALTTDYTINVTTANVNVNLFTAVGNSGKIINIKNSSNGKITVTPFGAQTIDNETIITIPRKNVCLSFQSTGTNWIII